MRDWYEKYERSGLRIVGVHSPEFAWERPLAKVRTAIEKLKITFPVVQDNDFAIWQRYGIWAWPTIVLTDKKGVIRYSHIGEGTYEKTGSMIEQLLQEK